MGNFFRSHTKVEVVAANSGKYRMVGVYGGGLYISSNYGVTWTQITSVGTQNFEYCGISRNGQYFVITTYGNYIYVSSDFGVTFSAKNTAAGGKNYQGAAVSDTGQYMMAGASGSYLYVSSDYGATWTARTAIGTKSWQQASISGNGQYQMIAAYTSGCYLSSDYGATFASTNTAMGTDECRGVAAGADGSYLTILGATTKKIYVSTNGGSSWSTQSTLGVGAYLIDISATGQYQIVRAGSTISMSSDFGATFPKTYSGTSAQNICITDDGLEMITCLYGGPIMQSKDSGTSFQSHVGLGNKNWFSAALCKTPG